MCQLSNFGCYTPDGDMVVIVGRMSGPDLTGKLIILSSSPQHLGPGKFSLMHYSLTDTTVHPSN